MDDELAAIRAPVVLRGQDVHGTRSGQLVSLASDQLPFPHGTGGRHENVDLDEAVLVDQVEARSAAYRIENDRLIAIESAPQHGDQRSHVRALSAATTSMPFVARGSPCVELANDPPTSHSTPKLSSASATYRSEAKISSEMDTQVPRSAGSQSKISIMCCRSTRRESSRRRCSRSLSPG